ncbi:hypothetical protein [Arthrobacter sp. Br18]|uniref:hypothetical protein n=1 Tax=Arthrobacter sp. Br18 TaxID=1312954 RepID=UPI00047CB45A|nr:hypothetical protein [Arthrobacter sp. Br18]
MEFAAEDDSTGKYAMTHGKYPDLEAYLDMHLMGATNGVRLFEAAARSWSGTRHQEVITRLAQDIDDERAALRRAIEQFGHRPGRVKMFVAHSMARLAAVNPVNPLRRKGNAGAQLELETLLSLLRGKEALWETLISLLHSAPAADRLGFTEEELLRLLTAARQQQAEIADIMKESAPDRFLRVD